jgi:hypothetical protein
MSRSGTSGHQDGRGLALYLGSAVTVILLPGSAAAVFLGDSGFSVAVLAVAVWMLLQAALLRRLRQPRESAADVYAATHGGPLTTELAARYEVRRSLADQVLAILFPVYPSCLAGLAATTVPRPAVVNGDGKHYDIGPVKPQRQALADLLGAKFGVDTIYGYRAHDPYPDHPSGLAIDLMVYADRAKGQQIADHARANADQLGIQYVIWYRAATTCWAGVQNGR